MGHRVRQALTCVHHNPIFIESADPNGTENLQFQNAFPCSSPPHLSSVFGGRPPGHNDCPEPPLRLPNAPTALGGAQCFRATAPKKRAAVVQNVHQWSPESQRSGDFSGPIVALVQTDAICTFSEVRVVRSPPGLSRGPLRGSGQWPRNPPPPLRH